MSVVARAIGGGLAIGVLLGFLGYYSGLPIEGGHPVAAVASGAVWFVVGAVGILGRSRSRRGIGSGRAPGGTRGAASVDRVETRAGPDRGFFYRSAASFVITAIVVLAVGRLSLVSVLLAAAALSLATWQWSLGRRR
jgi:hypothetical protein